MPVDETRTPHALEVGDAVKVVGLGAVPSRDFRYGTIGIIIKSGGSWDNLYEITTYDPITKKEQITGLVRGSRLVRAKETWLIEISRRIKELMEHPVEISLNSVIPIQAKAGTEIKLNLRGIKSTLDNFSRVEIRHQGNTIFIDAFAKPIEQEDDGVMTAGVESPWRTEVSLDPLPTGIYALKFNEKFRYLKWDRALTVL